MDTGVGGSHMMNIGDALGGVGGFTSSVLGSDSAANMYTGGGSVDPSSFSFVRNATSYNISVIYANSGNNANGAFSTVFGWIDSSNVKHQLYGPGATVTGNTNTTVGTMAFNPTGASYTFYATVCYAVSGGVCTISETYTTTSNNTGGATSGAGWNHFALFNLNSNSQSYVIAFEDTNFNTFGEGIGDFNDFVVELSVIPGVPEPATFGMIGLGLVGVAIAARKRFSK